MRDICPSCEKELDVRKTSVEEIINVRGEGIPVLVESFKCPECGEEFVNSESASDPLEIAFREYRRRHEMLQPEMIKEFRKKYGLTQAELAKLLGWGSVTLTRYENGSLQSETHDKTLKMAMEPNILLRLIKDTPSALSDFKRTCIVRELEVLEKSRFSFEDMILERFGDYAPDILSGYVALDLEKLFNAILYFCTGSVWKTKLNKLLFYSDFKYFKEYSRSITGARYAKLPYGPVVDNYELYFATLIHEERKLFVEEVVCGDCVGERYTSLKAPDLSLFSESELAILGIVKEHFKEMGAKQISDISHEEKGYIAVDTSSLISYEYAKVLSI